MTVLIGMMVFIVTGLLSWLMMSRALLVTAGRYYVIPVGFAENAFILLMQELMAVMLGAMMFAVVIGGFIPWVVQEDGVIAIIRFIPSVIIGYLLALIITLSCFRVDATRAFIDGDDGDGENSFQDVNTVRGGYDDGASDGVSGNGAGDAVNSDSSGDTTVPA